MGTFAFIFGLTARELCRPIWPNSAILLLAQSKEKIWNHNKADTTEYSYDIAGFLIYVTLT